MPSAYYNEIEPYAAQWLRNLMRHGLVAPGDVDTRSIEDVRPDDLRGYDQCHFFAGIGVWSHALRRAGWEDSRRVWTGSCPCQPFSSAGQGRGLGDERHLWPAWLHLIGECRPPVLFGEQVASKAAGEWVDLVQDDLEVLGYAFGAVPFPAASVGAFHIRDRLYWVAHANECAGGQGGEVGRGCDPRSDAQQGAGLGRDGIALGLADSSSTRLEGWGERRHGADERAAGSRGVAGFWSDAEWIWCRDGKWRPVEPGTFPLSHGASARVGRLRAYGNAIVSPQAEEWIRAVMECMP